MSRLRWVADGIERAKAAGGVELEVYRRPGFIQTMGVRVIRENVSGGSGVYLDPEPDDYEDRQ